MANRASEMKIAKGVVDELRSLSSSDAGKVISFLEHLAKNPYDGALIGDAYAEGDFFASKATDKLYVYWSFDVKGQVSDLTMQPKIKVLGLARKRSNHGFVPLFSRMDEKLKTA
jgi:hypothetical protein